MLHRNRDWVSSPILGYPIVLRVVDRGDLPDIPSQKIKIIGIGSRRFHYRMISLVDQYQIAMLDGNGHIQIRISGIDPLNSKTVLRPEPVVISFFVVRRIIPRVMAGRRKTRPIAAGSMNFVNG